MTTPFIQLFKTPRSQYVFDVNKSEMLPVTKETYSYLQQCMAGKADVMCLDLPEVQELLQNGYLRTESAVQGIRHPSTQHLEYLLDRKLSKITLQVTQGCNLRCKYCIYSEDSNVHQRSHSNKRMSWETAKRSIDFLWEHSVDSKRVNIGFYGGEPLLEFPLIKQIVAYARDVFDGKELTFTITTNGTLLTDEIISYFAQENIQLTISLDGPKAIHDKSRIFADGHGSFDTVMKNVARVKELAPDYARRLSFSMVMDPSNDYDCINEITVASEDMNKHTFLANIVDREYDGDTVIYSEEFIWKSQYQRFLALLSVFGRYPNDRVSAISRDAVGRFMIYTRYFQSPSPLHTIDVPSGPCVPGKLRLFVNTEGHFFPCERVSEKSKATCIGNLKSGFDIAKVENLLNVGSISLDYCKNCWSFRFCTICAKGADDGCAHLSLKKKLSHCKDIRANTYVNLRQFLLSAEAGTFYAEQVRGGASYINEK